jgi:D-arabinose 1-dehydrogenase-like Zn-dependent alcohol dehydrogenase
MPGIARSDAGLKMERKEAWSKHVHRQQSDEPAEELQKLGGAQVILATAPSSRAMSELINGMGLNGKLMVIGATFDPIQVTPIQLISGSRTIQGWAAETPADPEDTLRFAELSRVRSMIETYPLEKAAGAYTRMIRGHAHAYNRCSSDGNLLCIAQTH